MLLVNQKFVWSDYLQWTMAAKLFYTPIPEDIADDNNKLVTEAMNNVRYQYFPFPLPELANRSSVWK